MFDSAVSGTGQCPLQGSIRSTTAAVDRPCGLQTAARQGRLSGGVNDSSKGASGRVIDGRKVRIESTAYDEAGREVRPFARLLRRAGRRSHDPFGGDPGAASPVTRGAVIGLLALPSSCAASRRPRLVGTGRAPRLPESGSRRPEAGRPLFCKLPSGKIIESPSVHALGLSSSAK